MPNLKTGAKIHCHVKGKDKHHEKFSICEVDGLAIT
jgi:hypothetical protein